MQYAAVLLAGMESWRNYKTNDIQSPSMSKRTLVNAQRHVQQHQARAGRLVLLHNYIVCLFCGVQM